MRYCGGLRLHTHAHTHTYTHTIHNTHTYTYTHKSSHTQKNTHTYTYTYKHTNYHTHTHTLSQILESSHTQICKKAHAVVEPHFHDRHTHTHTDHHTQNPRTHTKSQRSSRSHRASLHDRHRAAWAVQQLWCRLDSCKDQCPDSSSFSTTIGRVTLSYRTS